MSCSKLTKTCDHKKRILWPVFGQNKIFRTWRSWISTPSTCLSCWPINIPSIVGIWCEQLEYDLEQGKNQHTQTQLKWRSLCAPLDIVLLLAISFFSVFGLPLFFWVSLTFPFYFFDIFSSLRCKKVVPTKNISLNKWKAWPMENLEVVLKVDKKLVTTKRGSCD